MKLHDLNISDFEMDEIVSIELVGERDTVDITVDDTHMFFANGVYSHNSSLENDVIEADKIADAYSKIMVSDFVMSVSRKINDKVSNTARFHIIKNRFGKDGMTFPADFNASIGLIDIHEDTSSPGKEVVHKMENTNEVVRQLLKRKYDELEGDGFE